MIWTTPISVALPRAWAASAVTVKSELNLLAATAWDFSSGRPSQGDGAIPACGRAPARLRPARYNNG